MTQKRGGRDARQDPELHDEETASNFRVDRVFVAPASAGTQPGVGAAASAKAPATAAAMAGTRRPRTGTGSPDAEIVLRRQLSQLQRQVADIQRSLADKDDELAAEIEKRVAVEASFDNLVDEQRVQQLKLEELTASSTRLAGVEQRVLDAVTTAEDLSRARDREKELRTQAETKLEDLAKQLEQAFASWKADRASLEEHHAADVSKLEQQKRMSSDAAATALLSATSRMRESHDEELAQLRQSNEQSLAILRGELEPKAIAALSLAEERQRLVDELASTKTEAARAVAERDETHQREHAQLVEQHTLELAQTSRTHAAELARVSDERDQHQVALLLAARTAEQREQHWEQTYAEATAARARVERDLAEARAVIERVTAEKASADERLASAAATIDKFVEDKRSLRERLELSEGESRRNAMDRRRFISYLENGLAMLRDADEEPDVVITNDDPDPDPGETLPSHVAISGMIDTDHVAKAGSPEAAIDALDRDSVAADATAIVATSTLGAGLPVGIVAAATAGTAEFPDEPSPAASGPYEAVPDSIIESQQELSEPTQSGIPIPRPPAQAVQIATTLGQASITNEDLDAVRGAATQVARAPSAIEPDAVPALGTEPEAAPPPEDDFAVTFATPVHEAVAGERETTLPAKKPVQGIDLDEELGLGPALVAALEAALAPAAAAAAFPTGEDVPPPPPMPRRAPTIQPASVVVPTAAVAAAAAADDDDEPSITVSRTMTDGESN